MVDICGRALLVAHLERVGDVDGAARLRAEQAPQHRQLLAGPSLGVGPRAGVVVGYVDQHELQDAEEEHEVIGTRKLKAKPRTLFRRACSLTGCSWNCRPLEAALACSVGWSTSMAERSGRRRGCKR